jgi:hypothetical protein
MNYSDLAAKLSQLGDRLARKSNGLEGEDLGRSAVKLASHLARFEEQLESHLASRKSGELLLESLLRSPSSKRHLTFPAETWAARNLRKTTEIGGTQRGQAGVRRIGPHRRKQYQAAEFLQNAFAQAVHVESGGKDKELLQREFVHLGQLLDDEFTIEIGSRTIAELRRIATVNGLKFTAKTNRQRLTALIRRYAQRAAFNVAAPRVPSRI